MPEPQSWHSAVKPSARPYPRQPSRGAGEDLVGFAAAVNAIYEHKRNYANGMNEAADGIEKASNALVKYNDIAAEVPQLREVISNPESSTQDVENAKSRLQEIAEMIEQEYNLKICKSKFNVIKT